MAELVVSDRRTTIHWTHTSVLYAAHTRMTSLDLFRGMIDGSVPNEPAMELIGAKVVAVEPGRVALEMTPAEHHYDLMGQVQPGILTALTDTTAGYAAHTLFPLGVSAATLEIHLGFLEPVTMESGLVTCIGTSVHAGGRTAFAEAVVIDAQGRLCAKMGTTLMIRR